MGDLLLVDFAAARDAVTDGLHVAAAHGQVQRAALGLVQVVDVCFLRVSNLLSCSSETVWVEKSEKGGLLHLFTCFTLSLRLSSTRKQQFRACNPAEMQPCLHSCTYSFLRLCKICAFSLPFLLTRSLLAFVFGPFAYLTSLKTDFFFFFFKKSFYVPICSSIYRVVLKFPGKSHPSDMF